MLLFPGISHALSLGKLKIHSHYAQPFSAEISIPSYSSDELENLQVQLADAENFKALGLEKMPFLSNFTFSIEKNAKGVPFIKIHSKQPVKELSVSFVIEASWVGGKIVKDYNALLTPEAITKLREQKYVQQTAQVQTSDQGIVQAPVATSPVLEDPDIAQAFLPHPRVVSSTMNKHAKNPVNNQRLERSSSQVKKYSANGLEYHNIQQGDTLSGIAMQMKGNTSASMYQVMVELYRQNPDAFVNNNINKLRVGANLHLQNMKNVTTRTRNQAIALVQQYSHTTSQQSDQITTSTLSDKSSVAKSAPKRLEISNTNEEPVPPEILAKLKHDQLTSAQQMVNDLQTENQLLKNKINTLETRMKEMASTLKQKNKATVPSSAPNVASNTQQHHNLVVAGTNTYVAKKEHKSFMQRIREAQTTFSTIALILLLVALIVVRKKDAIKIALKNRKLRTGIINAKTGFDENPFNRATM